jgi:hypothetical protein
MGATTMPATEDEQGKLKAISNVTVPSPVLGAPGTVTVKMDVTNDVTEIAAWIFRNVNGPNRGTAFPEPPLYAPRKVLTNVIGPVMLDDVGGAIALVGTPSIDNQVWAWSRAGGNIWTKEFSLPILFTRPTATSTVTVSGKACLFFAYAAPGYHGPIDGENDGEEGGPDHRPLALVIPANAKKVTLQATGGQWQHSQSAGDLSGADGLAGNNVTNHAAYKDDDAYNSGGINLLNAKFNRLVGLLERNFTRPISSSPVNQIDIGAGPTDVDLTPAGTYSRLLLGMHDSHEWDDNGGAVTVSVTWGF